MRSTNGIDISNLDGIAIVLMGKKDARSAGIPKEQLSIPLEERKEKRRAWEGQDEIVKANYEVPKRVQTKLQTLKALGRVKNMKTFVAEALEAALDKELAAAEREGY
jgi:hypothetical protein